MLKKCTTCHIEKPIEKYNKQPRCLFGVTAECKSCKKEKDKLRWENMSQEKKDRMHNMYREYYSKNKLEDPLIKREKWRVSKNKNRKSNELVRLKDNVRCRIWKYLNILNITKKNTTFEIVGCTPSELKEHISNKFNDGMSWSNYGEWHIDHTIPLSSAKNESELYKLFHYSNLQPLWAFDNMSKGNKIIN